jgi:hypothetical protein
VSAVQFAPFIGGQIPFHSDPDLCAKRKKEKPPLGFFFKKWLLNNLILLLVAEFLL